MKSLIIVLAASFCLVFWNLENFYDYIDTQANTSDTEFSARGARHWTRKRFYSKCNAVAKTLYALADREGSLPAVVCFAEIENAFVLKSLLSATLLRKEEYLPVHFDSPDPRGIDVALLYDSRVLKLLGASPHHLYEDGEMLLTRDILVAHFEIISRGDSLTVIVNHHPSKYSGASSQGKRDVALRQLKDISDSLYAAGWRNQVALGDFNDTPDNAAFSVLDGSLENLSTDSKFKGKGTIRFNGQWELIDQALIRGGSLQGSEMAILELPFLLQRDNVHPGDKPFRSYSGPRYIGGVSDHLPIMLRLPFEKECE